MPSSRADAGARRAGPFLALLLLTACAATPEQDADPAPTASSPPATVETAEPTEPTEPAPATTTAPAGPSRREVTVAMRRVLTTRSSAVTAHDLPGFLALVDPADAAFVTRQRGYFDALVHLPTPSTLALAVRPRSVRREGAGFRAVVQSDTQIAGFDALPVAGRQVFRFTPDPSHPGELLVAGDKGDALEPWTRIPVVLRTSHGVLGVFDAGSAPLADAVMRSATSALSEVATAVPYEWSRDVVVYALSTPTFLAGLDDVPGGDPLALDAVSFPVRSSDGRLAGTRIVLHPRMLGRGPDAARARDRLLRHEMVHVAVNEHDDRAPLWLSEGIAEYLSVRSLAPEDRTLSRAAISAARAGLSGPPPDEGFNGPRHEVSYGVSWWICEAIVDRAGELGLWSLLDAYAAAPDGADPDEVLRQTLGVDGRALAGKAARLLLAEYAR